MSEWLGQVPLRSRGLMLGAPQGRAGRFLGPARLLPSYELGRPVKRYHLGQLQCCNGPDGKGYCFDSGSGECVMTWVSASGGPPGSPACVQNPRGEWVHPSCMGLEPGPPSSRPELPPGCTYVAAEGNAMQEVICECYNCTTRASDGWRGMLSDFIAGGSRNPCLVSPDWFPKPAVCPSGPGGGGSYTPPAPTPTPTPTPTPIPTPYQPTPEIVTPVQEGSCPEGQVMIEGQCSVGAIACPSGGNYDLIEVEYESPEQTQAPQPTGRILARGIPLSRVQNAQGVHIVNASDPRCTTQSPVAMPTPQPSAQTVTQPASSEYSPPLPATEAPVLPARELMTRQALPTGSFPGQPFPVAQPRPAAAPNAPVPVAKFPAPMPEKCPLGPVPMADWVYGCMGIQES